MQQQFFLLFRATLFDPFLGLTDKEIKEKLKNRNQRYSMTETRRAEHQKLFNDMKEKYKGRSSSAL